MHLFLFPFSLGGWSAKEGGSGWIKNNFSVDFNCKDSIQLNIRLIKIFQNAMALWERIS